MTQIPTSTTRVLLARRPTGAPVPEDFRIVEEPLAPLAGQVVEVSSVAVSTDGATAALGGHDGVTRIREFKQMVRLREQVQMVLDDHHRVTLVHQ